jgi:hypothetical protein
MLGGFPSIDESTVTLRANGGCESSISSPNAREFSMIAFLIAFI